MEALRQGIYVAEGENENTYVGHLSGSGCGGNTEAGHLDSEDED